MRALLFAATMLATGSAQAGIYKCVIDGETIFSQQPCSPDAETIQLRGYPTGNSATKPIVDEATQPATAATDTTREATTEPPAADNSGQATAAEPAARQTPNTVAPKQEQRQEERSWRSGPIHGSSEGR